MPFIRLLATAFLAIVVAFCQVPDVPQVDPVISGTVTAADKPLPNVTITFSGGPQVLTDAAGAFAGKVKKGYTGTPTATLLGYAFTPAARTVQNVTAVPLYSATC